MIIVNGDLDIGKGVEISTFEATERVIVTGSITNNGDIEEGVLVQTNLQNIGYVAETDANYEYFTSGGKVYTFNGSDVTTTKVTTKVVE